ncbi:hypothetical protein AYI70_g5784, partial [Smittium culicis]
YTDCEESVSADSVSELPPVTSTITQYTDCEESVSAASVSELPPITSTITQYTDCEESVSADSVSELPPVTSTITQYTDCEESVSADSVSELPPVTSTITQYTDCEESVSAASICETLEPVTETSTLVVTNYSTTIATVYFTQESETCPSEPSTTTTTATLTENVIYTKLLTVTVPPLVLDVDDSSVPASTSLQPVIDPLPSYSTHCNDINEDGTCGDDVDNSNVDNNNCDNGANNCYDNGYNVGTTSVYDETYLYSEINVSSDTNDHVYSYDYSLVNTFTSAATATVQSYSLSTVNNTVPISTAVSTYTVPISTAVSAEIINQDYLAAKELQDKDGSKPGVQYAVASFGFECIDPNFC